MARADLVTLLPLDTWAAIMQISPWEFNQIGAGFPRNATNQCNSVWYQYSWQKDFASRNEVAEAISAAENAIADQLNYWPAPKPFIDEVVRIPHGSPLKGAWSGFNTNGWWKRVDLKWGYFTGGGLLNRTVINPAVVPVLSDPDGDTINERFTLTVATTETDPLKIGVYFDATGRMNEALSESWRIRPVKVTISGGNATITGHTSLLVKPSLETVVNPSVLDVTDASIYVTAVEVHRVWRDDTHTTSNPYQGAAIWDNPDDCAGAGCTESVLPICLAAQGESVFVSYDSPSTWPYGYQADRVKANYWAGYPLDSYGQMDRQHAEMVAYLATALLTSEKCGCERSNKILHEWRAKPNDGDSGRNFTQKEIDTNPFVQRNGALWAWKRIAALMQTGMVSL